MSLELEGHYEKCPPGSWSKPRELKRLFFCCLFVLQMLLQAKQIMVNVELNSIFPFPFSPFLLSLLFRQSSFTTKSFGSIILDLENVTLEAQRSFQETNSARQFIVPLQHYDHPNCKCLPVFAEELIWSPSACLGACHICHPGSVPRDGVCRPCPSGCWSSSPSTTCVDVDCPVFSHS